MLSNKIKDALRLSLFVLLALTLSGCGQDFGEDNTRIAGDFAEGQKIYTSQCASCHGPSGLGGSGGGLVGCASCGSIESLVRKVEKDMPSAANPLRGEKAKDVASYVFSEFNASSQGAVNRSMPGVVNATPKETVFKLAFELAGRLPTDEEVKQFSANLQGERAVVYGFMEEDYFYERLKDVFNDSILTDRHRRINNGNVKGFYNNNFRLPVTVGQNNNRYNVFPDFNWENDFVTPSNINISTAYLSHFTEEALARKPLLLVEYIARNNRDFREFVSGKYTVVNRFSYEAFGDNVKIVDPDRPIGNGGSAIADNVEWKKFASLAEARSYMDVVRALRNVGTNGDHYIMSDFSYDPRDLKAAQLFYNDSNGSPLVNGLPHSGIITDELFLNKYTATETNMHRNRARMIYWFFAGRDLLALEGNRDASLLHFDDFDFTVGDNDPTKSNPDCTSCHDIMDPVANAFSNYALNGLWDTRNPDRVKVEVGAEIKWGTTTKGTTSYTSRELQWLGEQIANDPAYAKGIAQIVFKGLTGQEILREPNLQSPDSYRKSFERQNELLVRSASEFRASGHNIKALVYAITKSAYYRSTNVVHNNIDSEYSQIGSVRYLPPQLLQQKLMALNSGGWSESLDLRNLNSRRFLGGKDSNEILTDADSVSGIISAVLERMAVEQACTMINRDFNANTPMKDRILFRYVERTTDLNASTEAGRMGQELAIRANIQYLHLAMLHKEVGLNSEEVEIAFDLFQDVLKAYSSDNRSGCNSSRNNAVMDAWYVVLVYLMTDYRFVYG